MKCPICGKDKGENELIKISPIYDDYMCYDCLPDDIKEEFDKCFDKQEAMKPRDTGPIRKISDTPKPLLAALRQYNHNDCSGLLFGFDYDETIKIFTNAITQAHMTGQADAGVDPGYSNAQDYLRRLINNT